jgi:hypothetical protein
MTAVTAISLHLSIPLCRTSILYFAIPGEPSYYRHSLTSAAAGIENTPLLPPTLTPEHLGVPYLLSLLVRLRCEPRLLSRVIIFMTSGFTYRRIRCIYTRISHNFIPHLPPNWFLTQVMPSWYWPLSHERHQYQSRDYVNASLFSFGTRHGKTAQASSI